MLFAFHYNTVHTSLTLPTLWIHHNAMPVVSPKIEDKTTNLIHNHQHTLQSPYFVDPIHIR